MGYAILMQWTPATPPGRTSISDLVLSRVLEHYNITHPLRSTIQFRTFRAAFPTPSSADAGSPPAAPGSSQQAASAHIRLLTTITYSQPIPPVREVAMPPGARDDITYLFLEDRGVPLAGAEEVKGGEQGKDGDGGDKGGKGDGDKKEGDKGGDKGGDKDGGMDVDKKENTDGKDGPKDDKAETGDKERDKVHDLTKETEADKGDDKKDTLSDDGFEIIEPPANGASASGSGSGSGGASTAPTAGDKDKSTASASTATKAPAPRRARSRYQILAVKPATLVMPTLHNLLSPFVLGLSKSARAQASTTGAATGAPTPLAGSPLVLTSLAFPPTAHPQPAIGLSVHMLPNAGAATIFLEAEWEGAWGGPVQGEDPTRGEHPGSGGYGVGVRGAAAVLREFLLGCVPEGVQGDARFSEWSGDEDGWSGPEKTRRMTSLLARALRESAFI